jgi:hypothetical protein
MDHGEGRPAAALITIPSHSASKVFACALLLCATEAANHVATTLLQTTASAHYRSRRRSINLHFLKRAAGQEVRGIFSLFLRGRGEVLGFGRSAQIYPLGNEWRGAMAAGCWPAALSAYHCTKSPIVPQASHKEADEIGIGGALSD